MSEKTPCDLSVFTLESSEYLSSAIFGASLFTFDWNPSSLNIPGLAHSKYQGVLAEPNLPSVTILRRGRFAREAAYRGICN